MNRNYLFLGIATAAVISLTAWLTYPSEKPTSLTDPAKCKFLHCPECKRESVYSATAAEKPCLYCDKKLVATAESIKQPGSSPYNLMGVLLTVEIVLFMGMTWLVARPRGTNEEANFLYINCENCRQRIRYHLKQIGMSAMCRRCKHAFVYPEADTD